MGDTYGNHGMDDTHGVDGTGDQNMDDIFSDEPGADGTGHVTGDFSGPPPEADDVGGEATGYGPNVVPVSALMDERRKRQAAEAQLNALADQADAWEPGLGDEGAWAPGYGPDPASFSGGGLEDGYANGYANGYADDDAGGDFVGHREHAHLLSTETAARSRYADFDHKLDVFERMALVDPHLVSDMRRSLDPSEYAYRAAERTIHGVQAPGRQPGPGRREHQQALAESLSGVQSATDHGDTRGWRPTPLEEILGA